MASRSGWHRRVAYRAACCTTLLVAWLAAGALGKLLHEACQDATCAYGTLPGTLDERRAVGDRWKLLSSTCPLQNLVLNYSANPTATQSSIVFLSDSMDYAMLKHFCLFINGNMTGSFEGKGVVWNKHKCYNTCKLNNITLPLAQVYLPTLTSQSEVQLSPSFHSDGRLLEGYKTKMAYMRGNWSLDHPGMEPTLVVLSGGLWDLMRWHLSPSLPADELKIQETKTLDDETLRWWMERAKEAIQHARSLFPQSRLVWRNYAMPLHNADGHMTQAVLGTTTHITQMRAAGWQAAREEGLELVDVAAQVDKFANPHYYLQDRMHPKDFVNLEILNVLLNIAARVRGNGAQPQADAPPSAR